MNDMMTIYAIARDPAGSYLDRFEPVVFKKKVDALDQLEEIARNIANDRAEPDRRFELESRRNVVLIVWQHGCGNEVESEVCIVRVEKILVPRGRLEFSDGQACVEDWAALMNKDPRFRDWDYDRWARAFGEAAPDHPGSEHSAEELEACCDWWKFIGVTDGQLDMPKFVAGCPWFMDHPECSQIRMHPDLWSLLLKLHPEFADRCESWDVFDGYGWRDLLTMHPEFAGKCDDCNGWSKLGGYEWGDLLATHPEFMEKCDACNGWSKLDIQDWSNLLASHPEFAEKCDDCIAWNKLDGQGWRMLLTARPEFAEKCDDCDGWSKLDGYDWRMLLGDRPEFAEKCDDCNAWHKLDGQDWMWLLIDHSDFARKCDAYNGWEKMGSQDWKGLLLKSPEYGDKCPCWSAFSVAELAELVESHRELANYTRINELSSEQITDMLIIAPTLEDLFDLNRIDNDIDRMRLGVAHSEFREKLPGSDKWSDARGYVWKGKSGPLVVVPSGCHPTWPREEGEYRAKRIGQAFGPCDDWMKYEEAQKVINEIFGWLSHGHKVIAVDGVYVDDEDMGKARTFAFLMKQWLENHETSLKILYLEYGSYYDADVLRG